jgi:hypothetical protein
MYKILIEGELAPPLFPKIWKNATMLRYKIFFWLLMHDRANTWNLLHRKSFHLPSYNCALCTSNTEETALHMFWDYNFALTCWAPFQVIDIEVFLSMMKFCSYHKLCQPPLPWKSLLWDAGIFGFREMGRSSTPSHFLYIDGNAC